jgi:hypothetical protein
MGTDWSREVRPPVGALPAAVSTTGPPDTTPVDSAPVPLPAAFWPHVAAPKQTSVVPFSLPAEQNGFRPMLGAALNSFATQALEKHNMYRWVADVLRVYCSGFGPGDCSGTCSGLTVLLMTHPSA